MGAPNSNPIPTKSTRIVVTGDIVMDWNLFNIGTIYRNQEGMKLCDQPGGAALMAEIIKNMTEMITKTTSQIYTLYRPGLPGDNISPKNDQIIHNFMQWTKKKDKDPKIKDKEIEVWRLQENLGYSHVSGKAIASSKTGWQKVIEDPSESDLIILDDADLGFRDNELLLPKSLSNSKVSPWILIKTANPLPVQSADPKKNGCENIALWEKLIKNHANRMILVLSVNQLRRAEVQISQEISWERTAQDLIWEMTFNPKLKCFAKCAHIIVLFGAAGAIHLISQPGTDSILKKSKFKAELIFDPKTIENQWESEHKGRVVGNITTLTAAIAREILMNLESPDIKKGIITGMNGIRNLHLYGYGVTKENEINMIYPIERILTEFSTPTGTFMDISIQDPLEALESSDPKIRYRWTILEQQTKENLLGIAMSIVEDGYEKALSNVPIGVFNDLTTVDRNEIEGFRSIRLLIGEYIKQKEAKRPLNIAVFGAPGSGKSFGIKQVANALFKEKLKTLEFNISQFIDLDDLCDALHQVRDEVLKSKIPLVIWDEFDCMMDKTKFGWLRYFLMPMQDGEFMEGDIRHPIGPAIFVFTGGTSSNLDEFETKLDLEEAKLAKVPDFISRIKGVVNIQGPNRTKPFVSGKKDPDPYYIIRRAFLLRSIFLREENCKKLLTGKHVNIDSGVLRALLQIKEYKRGVRSMESIINVSLLAEKYKFERSSLPVESQLEIHVNAKEFLALVQSLELDPDLVEQFSELGHEDYRERIGARIKSGEISRSTSDSYTKTWQELPENEREQNRDQFRDLPRKLKLIGYEMIPARGIEEKQEFSPDETTYLAKLEHRRWVKMKIADGWRCGPEKETDRKFHPCIVPWDLNDPDEKLAYTSDEVRVMGKYSLPDTEKKKDFDIIARIPHFIAKVGYMLVKIQ